VNEICIAINAMTLNISKGFKGGYIFLVVMLLVGAIAKSVYAPFSSILLNDINPMLVTSLLSFGAVIVGLPVFLSGLKKERAIPERHIHKKDTPALLGIIFFDLLGNLLFLIGLTMCVASSASLTKSFVIVATAVIAYIFLKERISKRLWIAIILITLGCITIAAGSLDTLTASPGLLFVLASCICSGFTYAFRKKVADRNPGSIILITNGAIAVICAIIAVIMGGITQDVLACIGGIVLGIITFGLPNILYQLSVRKLDATKCTTIYGLSPFIGAGISFIIFQQIPTIAFFISFILIIPGFYLVIMDREDKDKFKNTTSVAPPVEKYHDIRNYLVSVGFLFQFAGTIGVIISAGKDIFNIPVVSEGLNIAFICLSLVQIAIGCMVIILRRRDLAGIVLLMGGFSTALICISDNNRVIIGVVAVICLLLAVIMFLGKERKKYFFSILFLLAGISSITCVIFESDILQIIMNAIIALYILFLDIGYSGIIPRFPGTKILVEDETTDFSIVGSGVCYIIAAISVLPWMITYLFSSEYVSLNLITNFFIACGILMGIVATMIIFAGKENKFIGVVFLCVTMFLILSGFTTGVVNYIAGIIMFMAGVIVLLRKKSLLLVGLMCILYGISSFTSVLIYGESILVISQFVMQVITFVVATYLAIAVFSQSKKLPLF